MKGKASGGGEEQVFPCFVRELVHTLVFTGRKNGYPTGYPLALPSGALNRYLQINQRRSDYFNRLYLIVFKPNGLL